VNAGAMVVLAILSVVALVGALAGVVTWRRHLLARAQTRRAQALLVEHAEAWSSVTDGSGGHGNAGRSRMRQPDRPASEPAVVDGDLPDTLSTTATHKRRAS
jgi:hypothetical protein